MSPAPELKRALQRELRVRIAAFTGGLAPEDYAKAWWDWSLGVSKSRQKREELLQSGFAKALDSLSFAFRAASGAPLHPAPQDRRFADGAWSAWPFNVFAHAYSNWSAWLQEALSGAPGVPERSTQLMGFVGRHVRDATSPGNFLPTNPELLEVTRAEAGRNLIRGFSNGIEDLRRTVQGRAPAGTESFKVGEQVAVTPGKVVLRNRLIELIQYSPQADAVQAEPVLITPAWIMKYYILDLSSRNSLVRYLVEQGHTVFMISWKNPGATDRDLGMDDYVQSGFVDALDAVTAIVPQHKVHALGYCIGGTLLTIAAAALAQAGDTRLATITLLAAQTDFSEPGELSLFISPSQIDMLEAIMHRAGVLDSRKMGAAFALLRAQDLLWTPAVDSYVRGKRQASNDLMSWNADGTRLPWRMHTDYLTRLYLRNELALGEFTSAGQRLELANVRVPMFVVGTETDHVAPWRSVYKARGLTRSSDYTFLLTSGGHNAGIVSGPAHPRRRYRVRAWQGESETLTPEEWESSTVPQAGSWWPEWERWLTAHSSSKRVPPPPMGNTERGLAPLVDAPGEYVHER